MSDFDPPLAAIRALVARALAEDVGVMGDITSIATVAESAIGTGAFVPREPGVLAGTRAAGEVFAQVDPEVSVVWSAADGAAVGAGEVVGEVRGRLRSLLLAERTALNLLTHCSGIATTTAEFVRRAVPVRVRDTRKTIPGLRALQKAAVRAGGGVNHRDSLSDAVLIKDNHLSAIGIVDAVTQARACWPGRVIEVECDTLDQVADARAARADIVLVDNMTPDEVREAVKVLDGTAALEISGGITLDTVAEYANTGADYVAVGALTHSVRTLDIGLDIITG
ncbi:MAG TPA: carboxylating nicotinate-nucleotide diphosphorylase [Acidimicrobiia bacterium]|nr:carboxylating nicotinate-nucleotide diphosphorylase [Acidimicrobiia bacterium]